MVLITKKSHDSSKNRRSSARKGNQETEIDELGKFSTHINVSKVGVRVGERRLAEAAPLGLVVPFRCKYARIDFCENQRCQSAEYEELGHQVSP